MMRSVISAMAAMALLAGCVEDQAYVGGPTYVATGLSDGYLQTVSDPGPQLAQGGGGLSIVDADYGERGRYCNAERRIGRECNGRRGCEFEVGNHLCGDPAPGQLKELRLRFACEGRRRSDEDYVRAREGQRIRLECERGQGEAQVIGRPAPGGPGGPYPGGPYPGGPGPGRSDIRVVDARYGGGGRECNATGAVAGRCNGQDRCSVRADNNLCGDPAYGQPKSLTITYLCRGSQRYAAAREGQRADLGC